MAVAAAWGASVGPVWSIALALLNGIVEKQLFGLANADSAFAAVLLAGALLGALGGALAGRAGGASAAVSNAPG